MNLILLGIIALIGLYAVENGKITLPASVSAALSSLAGTVSSAVTTATGAVSSAAATAESTASNLSVAEAAFYQPLNVTGSGGGTEVGIGSTGLGGGTSQTGKEVDQAVTTGLGITATVMTSALAMPVAGAFVAAGAGLVALFSSIFHGANPLQVDAAKVEQCYEAAADNMMTVFSKLQMITRAEAISAINALTQAGQDMEGVVQKSIGTPAAKGSANIAYSNSFPLATVTGMPEIGDPAPIDLAKARTVYVGGSNGESATGWYADSVATAATLTDNFLTALGG